MSAPSLGPPFLGMTPDDGGGTGAPSNEVEAIAKGTTYPFPQLNSAVPAFGQVLEQSEPETPDFD